MSSGHSSRPVIAVCRGRRSAYVDPEQATNHDSNQAWRDVAHLHVTRFLPYGDDNDGKHDQDERDCGEDDQDQRGKHQLSTPMLMI